MARRNSTCSVASTDFRNPLRVDRIADSPRGVSSASTTRVDPRPPFDFHHRCDVGCTVQVCGRVSAGSVSIISKQQFLRGDTTEQNGDLVTEVCGRLPAEQPLFELRETERLCRAAGTAHLLDGNRYEWFGLKQYTQDGMAKLVRGYPPLNRHRHFQDGGHGISEIGQLHRTL